MEILVINGHDYSPYIERAGYGWSREDLDGENAGRTKDGKMRRDKVAAKRKLSYTLMHMARAQLAQLDTDLSAPTFTAAYLDLHGRQTRTFYSSSFSCTLQDASFGDGEWNGASFNLIEV